VQIRRNISLKPFNTFGIRQKAKLFCTLTSQEDITNLLQSTVYDSYPHLFLGGGSNILFTQDFPGLVIKNQITGIELLKEDRNHVWVKAMSGENWHEFVLHCIANKWSGIENLSLIPGTVGAAPMQNIGAYGVEIKDVFDSLEAIDLDSGSILQFGLNDCKFGYRESVFKNTFKNKFFILSMTLKLNKKFIPHIKYGAISETLKEKKVKNISLRAVSNAVISIRQSKLPDPKKLGNSGSFFKNPVIPIEQFKEIQLKFPHIKAYPVSDTEIKVPAGWLIEQAGWKGKRIGNTGSHKNQALVLVNYGKANGEEVKKLAYQIKDSVKQLFGIEINPEVNIY